MLIHYRRTSQADMPAIKAFIQDHWRKDHPFLSNQELLDFQHQDALGEYQFSIAEDVASRSIRGMCGWISYKKWDPELRARNAVWFTNWFIDPNVKGAAGLRIQEMIARYEDHAWLGTVGLRPNTLPLYKARRFETGRMIAITDAIISRHKYTLPRLSQEMLVASDLPHDYAPAKTPALFARKYLANPFRQYDVVDVSLTKEARGIAVFRREQIDEVESYHLIDYCGSKQSFAGLRSSIRSFPILSREATFKLSVNESSFPSEWLGAATHDEPIREETLYAIRGPSSEPYLICRGDGDHDRIPG